MEVRLLKEVGWRWTALGGTVHTLPADDLAKMKTLLDPVADEVTKYSAGRARHAAESRCRQTLSAGVAPALCRRFLRFNGRA